MSYPKLRLDIVFATNPSQATSNAGKTPYIFSGNASGKGLGSATQIELAQGDRFLPAPLPGGQVLLIFTVATNSSGLNQGFWNTRAAGIGESPPQGYIEIEMPNEPQRKLYWVEGGYADYNAGDTKFELVLKLSEPTIA